MVLNYPIIETIIKEINLQKWIFKIQMVFRRCDHRKDSLVLPVGVLAHPLVEQLLDVGEHFAAVRVRDPTEAVEDAFPFQLKRIVQINLF